MIRRSSLAAILALAVMMPAQARAASADVRSLSVAQAPFAAPTLSGFPDMPDLSTLSVSYDQVGSLSFTLGFHNPVTRLDQSDFFAWYGQFVVGNGNVANDPGTFCVGGATGTFTIPGISRTSSLYSVSGFNGEADFSPALSSDGLTLRFTISSPALTGKDYTCAHVEIDSFRHASPSDPYSRYDSSCVCWKLPGPTDAFDSVDRTDSSSNTLAIAWFDGYMPQVFAKLKLSSVTCSKGVVDYGWEIDPDRVGPNARPYKAVHLHLRGVSGRARGVVRSILINPNLSTNSSTTYRPFRLLKSGTYTLTAAYPGDNFRLAAKQVTAIIICR